jgi:hypothetical protein
VLKRFSPDRLGEQIFAVYKKLKAFWDWAFSCSDR